MTTYVDASVLLRVLLGQPDRLPEWGGIERALASSLIEVECLRTLDRLRLRTGMGDVELSLRRETVFRLTAAMDLVEPSPAVLRRAAQPLPTSLGTLDAIHLATAMLWRDREGETPVMATHDRALGTAARACGFGVVGT